MASIWLAASCGWQGGSFLLIIVVKSSQERQGKVSGCVNLYTDDGEHCKNATLQRASLPTALAWHPTQRWLASGWGNGEIVLFNDKIAHECKALHISEIDVLEWSRDGSILVSGDADGRVGVWKAAKNGKLVCPSIFLPGSADTS
jgi:WD40 repeat protein